MDSETFEQLASLADEWAKKQEEVILSGGVPLGTQQLADARLAGVQDAESVRVLVVDRIPFPEDSTLAAMARQAHIVTDSTRCMSFGHGILTRADAWGDRELLVHNLVHTAQCERAGGLKPWVRKYLFDRRTCAKFTMGPLEEEARNVARAICSGETGGTGMS